MRHRRSIAVALAVLVACAGGCGSLGSRMTRIISTAPEQESQLESGVEYLKAGNERNAREMLEKVVLAQPLPGVTDEALFRLSLLYLRDEGGKGETQSLALLERLKRDYPNSVWSLQSAPMAAYLRTKQREQKVLRERNLSLTRDNKDLRQSIERLKNLDLELEQRIKR